MSPGSQLQRKRCVAMERSVDKRKLARYEPTEVTLADQRHTEMCNVMDTIDQVAVEDLEKDQVKNGGCSVNENMYHFIFVDYQ